MFRNLMMTSALTLAVVPCVASTQVAAAASPQPITTVTKTQNDSNAKAHPEDPTARSAALLKDGYKMTSAQKKNGIPVEVYRKQVQPGITAEYSVACTDQVRFSGEATPYWNVGWDNGPRLYMTGTEFWSHSASAIATAACSLVGSPIAGVACGLAADGAWGAVSPHIAKDDTCYDLSQFMNKGWEKAPANKCS